MESVACCVALGEDEHATLSLIDVVGEVDDFEKQMRQELRVSWRADAVVHSGKVGDVGLIALVKIDAIPARLKVDLRSEPGVALGGLEAWSFWLRAAAVETGEADTICNR